MVGLLIMPACKMAGFNTVESINRNMVSINGGSFEMGCSSGDSECYEDEIPVHTVSLSSFKMSAYEVTQGQWEAVMGNNPSSWKRLEKNLPVETVSWEDVQTFIETLNSRTGLSYRLPTEAEWEYAARAGTTTKYSCGNDASCLEAIAWYADTGKPGEVTHSVGTKAPNAWGLYDMSGNVAEWVSDWYNDDYYAVSPGSNPTGPDFGSGRVKRGGGFYNNAYTCRVSKRNWEYPDGPSDQVGFRLVLP